MFFRVMPVGVYCLGEQCVPRVSCSIAAFITRLEFDVGPFFYSLMSEYYLKPNYFYKIK